MISDLNDRSREILRLVVDAYVETGEPVGSRTISRRLGMGLSPATIRNVMADLEDAGLLYAPHTSAGRMPTEAGLRIFIDGLLELGGVGEDERQQIEAQCAAAGRSLGDVLSEASGVLSGLSGCAGLVLAPKTDRPLKHLEFVPLGPDRALVVLVTEDGVVENRVLELPPGLPASALVTATNWAKAKLVGRTLGEVKSDVDQEIESQRSELDQLTSRVVAAGLAMWAGGSSQGQLIVRGQANLLDDVQALTDLERIRGLFEALEAKETVARLLDATSDAQGVKIFIGAENDLFGYTGCSVIVTPYTDKSEQIIGAIGVIGPTRVNYARIIPIVDYTAKVVSRLIG